MSHPESTDPPRVGRDPLLLRVVDKLSSGAAVFAGLALVALLANVAIDVMARTFLGRPVGQTLELTMFWWMPVMITLSYAVTEREREHITVTLLLDRLNRRSRRYVEGSFTAIGAVLVTALAWYASMDALAATEVRMAANSTPPLQYWPAMILAAAGLSLFAVQLAASTFRHFTDRTRYTDELPTEADSL